MRCETQQEFQKLKHVFETLQAGDIGSRQNLGAMGLAATCRLQQIFEAQEDTITALRTPMVARRDETEE